MNKTLSRCIVPFGVALIAGLSLIAAVNRFKSYDRSVSVRGLCEREVKADVAYYPISFSRDGNNLVDLNKDMQTTNKSVVEFLKKNGFEDSEITLTVPTINDHRSESYRREGLADYTMNQTITLYTKKIDQVLAIQNKSVTSAEGLVEDDVDRCIHNLTRLGSIGMNETDRMVLDIMTHKG